LIANHTAWKNSWKRKKIETLAMLLKGALEAETKVGLKMNIEEKNLARLLIPQLKAAGAEGIIEYPLNKVVY
jgi:ATP phosphoribosyltransferase